MERAFCFRRLDREFARIAVLGQDRVRFLSGMLSCDVKGLSVGQAAYGALLSVKGKVISDLLLLQRGDAGLLALVPVASQKQFCETLDRYLICDDVTLQNDSAELAHLGVYGRKAAEYLFPSQTPPLPYQHIDLNGLLFLCCRDLGENSFHVLGSPLSVENMERDLLSAGAVGLSEQEAEVFRVESGRPKWGIDFDENNLPQEASLDEALCFTKGCFLGQEVVVRLRDRGHVNRKLLFLRLSGTEIPPSRSRLSHPTRSQAGELTSSVHSTRFGVIALGYVQRGLWDIGTTLQVTNAAGEKTGQTAVVSHTPAAPLATQREPA
jgi:folate-binding protein YgfZ